MIPASPEFKKALTASHVALTRAVVLNPQADGTYAEGVTLAIASGGLSIDGSRNVWRQGNFVLAPASPFLLDPLDDIDGSTRLRIDRGIRMFQGFEEWVTIAVLQVQQASRSLNQGTLSVSAYDLGSAVQDYPVAVWSPINENYTTMTSVEAIKYLVDEAMWDAEVIWTVDPEIDLTATPPEGTTFTGNRWTIINSLANSLGAIAHADYDGTWRLRKVVNQTPTLRAMEVVEGGGGVLVDRTISKSRREMFNAVQITWETPTISGTVFVVDSDPASPTYWDGPWGKKTAPTQKLDTITTEEQAIDAAYALLETYKGRARKIDFRSVHNPLIEPFDVIAVSEAEIVGGLRQLTMQEHILDAIEYPLAGGEMAADTREVTDEVIR